MTPDERESILTMTDGDTTELSDGRIVRLKIESDDTNPFDNYDCYGKVAFVDDRRSNTFGEPATRPEGFTGNAEKIWLQQNGGCIWWEPPKDGPKRTDPEFASVRSMVNDLASFGMNGMVLELCDGTDAYGRPVVKDVASLWGIEPFADDGYRRKVIGDLLSELGIDS
jgi:hypothetical protein